MRNLKAKITAIAVIITLILPVFPAGVFADETPQITVKSSHSATYQSADCWVNVNAEITGAAEGDTVTFFLTNSSTGTEEEPVSEETVVSCAVSELPASMPEVVMGGSRSLGFMISGVPAGQYYIGCCLTSGETRTYAYKSFTVYGSISSFASAYKDKLIAHYRNDLFWRDSEYVGLSMSTGNETGIDWEAWMFTALGYSVDSSLLAGSDGKTYLDHTEEAVSDSSDLTIKDYFRYITALAACGEDPRSFRGNNLIAGMMSRAAQQNLVANAGSIDLLSLSYFVLACRIAGVTEEEGFSAADQKICYEALINDYDKTIGTGDRTKYINADNYAMSVLPLCFDVDDTELQSEINAAKNQLVRVFSEEYMFANGAIEYGRPGSDNTRFGYANADSIAVFINTLVLMGYTAADLEGYAWQKEYGSLITAFISQILDNGGAVYGDVENRMATYQTLGALVDLINGKSCFAVAADKYRANYPDYFNGGSQGGQDDPPGPVDPPGPINPPGPLDPDDPTYEPDGDPITAYVTVSKNGDFVKGCDDTILMHVPVRFGYFDLAKYGLQDFKRKDDKAGQPTLLHLLIRLTEQYYLGRTMTTEDLASDAFRVSGSFGSLYLENFWGHNDELMYFVNHEFPIMTPGTGATCDYIVMSAGDEVDLAMFTETGFEEDGAFTNFDKEEVRTKEGEAVSLTLRGVPMNESVSGASADPVPMAGETIRISSDGGATWQDTGIKTDESGAVSLTFDKAGTYHVSNSPEGNTYKHIAPAACKVTVDVDEEKAEEERRKEEERKAKEEAVGKANELLAQVSELDAGGYTAESYKAVMDAGAALEALLSKEDSASTEINTARAALEEAVSGLVQMKPNALKVTRKNKTFRVKNLKKARKSYKAVTVKGAKGKVTYKISGNKKSRKALKFNKKNGKITVKKGTKKGTYKLKIRVKAAGTALYKAGSKAVTVKVRVK